MTAPQDVVRPATARLQWTMISETATFLRWPTAADLGD